jgi:hypothetical protein
MRARLRKALSDGVDAVCHEVEDLRGVGNQR